MEGIGSVVVFLSIVFFVLMVMWAIAVINQLKDICENTDLARKHLLAIRFPEIGIPPPPPDYIVHEEQTNGRSLRLRADGIWQEAIKGKWINLRRD